jgi:HPt (histidine-containing phosphotransfer) domain-containing protein
MGQHDLTALSKKHNINHVDFDTTYPIDKAKVLENMGDEELFFEMLKMFEDMTLIDLMTHIADQIETKNFLSLKDYAHQLKGASSNIGAGKIHMVCYHIQENYLEGNYDSMIDWYPDLI